MSTPQQTSSAVVPRVVDGKLASLYARPPRLDSSLPQVRDLAAAPLPQQQAERSAEDSSDDLSQSSASSAGGRSGAASSLSSMHPQGSSFSFEWTLKDDQRLGELAKEHGLFAWVKIAEILTDEGHGYRIGKQCRER